MKGAWTQFWLFLRTLAFLLTLTLKLWLWLLMIEILFCSYPVWIMFWRPLFGLGRRRVWLLPFSFRCSSSLSFACWLFDLVCCSSCRIFLLNFFLLRPCGSLSRFCLLALFCLEGLCATASLCFRLLGCFALGLNSPYTSS